MSQKVWKTEITIIILSPCRLDDTELRPIIEQVAEVDAAEGSTVTITRKKIDAAAVAVIHAKIYGTGHEEGDCK